MTDRIRVVLAGEDEFAAPVARMLRDAGIEVVLIGARSGPAQIVAVTVQEDAVAVVCSSCVPVRAMLAAEGSPEVVCVELDPDEAPEVVLALLHSELPRTGSARETP